MVVCKQVIPGQVRVAIPLLDTNYDIEVVAMDIKEVFELNSETVESRDIKVVIQIKDYEVVAVFVTVEGMANVDDSQAYEINEKDKSYFEEEIFYNLG